MNTRLLFFALLVALIAQTAHYAEHVAQMIQIYVQYIAPAKAHGLLGSVFDFELVHFSYNVGLELILIWIWWLYRADFRAERSAQVNTVSTSALGFYVLTGLIVFQGYHSIEHIVKLYQYLFVPLYRSGMPPTPGILPIVTGWPIFLIHFWLNAVVWCGMVWAAWCLRPRLGRSRLRSDAK